jgi:hypothetical protein
MLVTRKSSPNEYNPLGHGRHDRVLNRVSFFPLYKSCCLPLSCGRQWGRSVASISNSSIQSRQTVPRSHQRSSNLSCSKGQMSASLAHSAICLSVQFLAFFDVFHGLTLLGFPVLFHHPAPSQKLLPASRFHRLA